MSRKDHERVCNEWKRALNQLRNKGKIIFPGVPFPSEGLSVDEARSVYNLFIAREKDGLTVMRMVNIALKAAFTHSERNDLGFGVTEDMDVEFTGWFPHQINVVLRFLSATLLKKGSFKLHKSPEPDDEGGWWYIACDGVEVEGVLAGFRGNSPRLVAEPLVELLCWTLYQRLIGFFEDDENRVAPKNARNAVDVLDDARTWVSRGFPEALTPDANARELTTALFTGPVPPATFAAAWLSDAVLSDAVGEYVMAKCYSRRNGEYAVRLFTECNLRQDKALPLDGDAVNALLERVKLFLMGWGLANNLHLIEFDGEIPATEREAARVWGESAYHKGYIDFLTVWGEIPDDVREWMSGGLKEFFYTVPASPSVTAEVAGIMDRFNSFHEFQSDMNSLSFIWAKEYRRALVKALIDQIVN